MDETSLEKVSEEKELGVQSVTTWNRKAVPLSV